MKEIFISTSIPYVNARPHIGHALEFIQADALARYHRLIGNDVFFTSGTDDNALKNVIKAEEVGEKTPLYVKRHSETFRELCKMLDISNDYFLTTAFDESHHVGAQKLWNESMKHGDIYRKKYQGIYCVGCEEFKTEKELTGSGECPEHPGKKPDIVEEENYFFRLSRYQEEIGELLTSRTLQIIPDERRNEALAFVRDGLRDFSISRSYQRAHGWGISVPNDPSQVIYVWFDALSNYINALGYAQNKQQYIKFWVESEERIHIIGKGINKFHTVYWPAILMSAKVPLPTKVFVHGYLTMNGQKMSKSLGNTLDPEDLIKKYGSEAVRYYFLRHQHPTLDGDFTIERFEEAYTANLANGIGNLVARTMNLAEKYLDDPIPVTQVVFPDEYQAYFDNFDFKRVTDYIWQKIGELDKDMIERTPFKLIRTDRETAKRIITEQMFKLYMISYLLQPILPKTSIAIMKAIQTNKRPPNLFNRLAT